MQGWIKLHRKIRSNPVFNDLQLYRLWTICLLEASHASREQPIGKQIVSLEPGQFVTGRYDLHAMYNSGLKRSDHVAEYTVWRWLLALEKHGLVSINSSNKFSTVSVVNWSFYQEPEQQNEQDNEQQVSSKRASNEQQVSTNKNVKNLKNERIKELKTSYAEFVSLTEAEHQKLVEQYGEDNVKRMIEVLDNYKGSNNKKYASDYRAILNWVVDRVGAKKFDASSETKKIDRQSYDDAFREWVRQGNDPAEFSFEQ